MKRESWQYTALVLVLLVAALFRFYGLAWDNGYLFHPDERKILLVAWGIHLPASIAEFLSSDSPLNPKFFAYGSFPIYLLRALGAFAPATAYVVPWREDLVSLALLGRTLSALFDLGTIVLIFLFARRLYDSAVGLVAAACVAVTVLHIQLSHFYAVDTLLTFFVVATMFFAARFAQMGKRRDAVLIGVAFGLALATKTSAAPLIVPIVIAVVQVNRGEGNWLDQIWVARKTLLAIAGVAVIAFVVTQPYVLLDPIRYFGQVGTEWLVARGWLDYPYTRQYADTLPFIYPIVQSSVWGMSVPLGIFAWGGSALFLWRWWRKRELALSGVKGWRDGFILSWALVYLIVVGGQYAKYLRYLLPLLPFLFLMAGASLKSQISGVKSRAWRFTSYVSILFALVYSITFVGIYSREHPWLQISRWIYANMPANSTIAVEYWDDVLPVPLRVSDATRAPTEYRLQTLPMYDADDMTKLDMLVAALGDSDYIVLATQRLSGTIMRLPQRYPISSRYYRLLLSGQLGFEAVASAVNGIALDGIVIADDRFDGVAPPLFFPSDALLLNWGRADESFTVYDHPLPLVFKKTRALSRDELHRLLSP